jgi:hypothetical protein
MKSKTDITGRDGYITAQALVYASEWLRSLDELHDEPSNWHDMDSILSEMFSQSIVKLFRWQAQCKLTNKTWETAQELDADFNAFMQGTDRTPAEDNAGLSIVGAADINHDGERI